MKMNESNLIRIWCSQDQESEINFKNDKLMESLIKTSRRLDKQVERRDLLEIIAALILIVLFGWWLIALPGILAKTGSAFIIGGSLLIIYRLINAKKVKESDTMTSEVRRNLEISLKKVQSQIKLLNSVLWWYILPIFTGVILFNLAFIKSFVSLVIFTLITAGIFGWIFYINKKAVRDYLRPIETNIKNALEELSKAE